MYGRKGCGLGSPWITVIASDLISPFLASSLLQSRFNMEAKWVFLKHKPDFVTTMLKILQGHYIVFWIKS